MGSEMCIRDSRTPHYLRHFREAVVSVRERQCWSCVARPIIYVTSVGVWLPPRRGRKVHGKTREI